MNKINKLMTVTDYLHLSQLCQHRIRPQHASGIMSAETDEAELEGKHQLRRGLNRVCLDKAR